FLFFFSSRRRHTRCLSDWSSDVCSSDLDRIFRRSSLMRRRFLAVFSGIILLVAFAMVLSARNHRASRSSNAITVTSQTRGDEVLTAEFLNDQVKIRLKNNHKDTITTYAIRLSDTTISEDFAYSEVGFGI